MTNCNINMDKLYSSKQSLKDLKLLNFIISYCSIKCSPEKLLVLYTCTFYFYFYFLVKYFFTFSQVTFLGVTFTL